MSTSNYTDNNTAYARVLDALRAHGCHVDDHGQRATAQAPGHSIADRSIVVTSTPGQVLVHSHSDPTADVLDAIGLGYADLFDEPRGVSYDYPDGRHVHRGPSKKFRQTGNTKGRSLYRADRIGAATIVYYVEGEKDVLAVEAAGGAAVCNAQGAGKSHLADLTPLAGKTVIVVADKDQAGLRHAQQVVAALAGVAASTVIVEAAVGKDAADHIAAGKGLAELVPVAVDVQDTQQSDSEPEFRAPQLWKATDLRAAAQPRWLAKGRLPRASISLLVGDEGIGKSLLWVWLVAAVTTGRPLPEFGIPARTPLPVIVVVTEDDWSTTVLPRLQVADADLDHISVICTDDDGSGAPTFPRDLHLVVDADPAPALVVVDAWLDTVPSGLSVRDPQQARRALHPWREVATITDAAVLLLTHTNRVATGNARDKYGATGELRKKARMTLFAQQDDDGNLLVGPEKSNTTNPLAASKFTIDGIQHFDATEDHDGTVPLLRYVGDSDLTARDHIADAYETEHGDDAQDRVDAEKWLYGYLEVEGPSVESGEVKREAKKVGIAERTLQRARKKLLVVIGYTGNPPRSTWSLPEQGGVIDSVVVESEDVVPPTRGTTHMAQRGIPSVTSGNSAEESRCATPESNGTTWHNAVMPPTPVSGGTTAESGISPGPSVVPPPKVAQRGTASPARPIRCRVCSIDLPRAATTDVCDECGDPAHQIPQPAAARPLTVVHNGYARRGKELALCPHCDEALVYDDDCRDGFHTSKSKCVRAHNKKLLGDGGAA